ncbi:MAG: hypothetical protein PHQ53_11910 [Candidatus Krumholzibacteria bacterium]|nr:hypothetical protein [Candidatus Krumholzibacteria bacterium]
MRRNAARRALLSLLLPCLLLPAATSAVTPEQPPLTLHLEELWRDGGANDDFMIGLPVEAVADTDGRVYLADQQLCRVFVFERDGQLAGTLSREGEGPGEVRGPVDVVLLPDGTVGVAEFFPGRLVKLTRDDLPAGEVVIDVGRGKTGGFTIQTMAESAGEHLLVAGSRSVPKERVLERTHFLAMIDQQGRELVRFTEQIAEIQRPHSVVHEDDFLPCFPLASTLGPDGRVYAPRARDRYEVAVYRPDGALERVIERPEFITWRRDQRDHRRILALFQAWASPNPETWPEFDLEKTERAISALHIDDRGRLWVQHSRSNRNQPDGVFLTLDLYAPDGRWLREVSLVCEGNSISDGLRFLRDGRVLLIKGFVVARLACLGGSSATFGEDDAATVEIVCYRLPAFD